jgi:hypothetical protein
MSVTISVSKTDDGIWIIRNAIYRWFVDLARNRFVSDDKLIEAFQKGEYFGGVSLELEYESDPNFATHLRDCIRQLASEIAAGQHNLDDWPEMQDKCNAAFKDLAVMLGRHQF